MKVKPLRPKLEKYLKSRKLLGKYKKQLQIFAVNPRHPSLHTELLEPKHLKIYSFRLDKRYRVIFVMVEGEVEVVDINDHYHP